MDLRKEGCHAGKYIRGGDPIRFVGIHFGKDVGPLPGWLLTHP